MPGKYNMKKIAESIKYPLFILIVLVILTFIGEVLISEGSFGTYLQLPEHRILKFMIRGVYAILFFILGYKGLQQLGVRWITKIWFLWYGIAICMLCLRILLNLQFKSIFSSNVFNFFIPFYSLLLTPFPYLFLLLLNYLFKQKSVK